VRGRNAVVAFDTAGKCRCLMTSSAINSVASSSPLAKVDRTTLLRLVNTRWRRVVAGTHLWRCLSGNKRAYRPQSRGTLLLACFDAALPCCSIGEGNRRRFGNHIAPVGQSESNAAARRRSASPSIVLRVFGVRMNVVDCHLRFRDLLIATVVGETGFQRLRLGNAQETR